MCGQVLFSFLTGVHQPLLPVLSLLMSLLMIVLSISPLLFFLLACRGWLIGLDLIDVQHIQVMIRG
jgi:hypothetical protein